MEKSKDNIQVRRATKEEVTFLAENTAKIAWETEQKVCDTQQTIKFTLPGFDYPDSTSFWIASINGEDAGSMCNTIEYNVAKNSSYTWFQSVYIRAEHRGKKIFTEMFQKSLEEAKKAGHIGLKLYVERNNDRARNIYQHLGMKFPKCEIFESDLIFSFNATEYDVEKIESNFQTFKQMFIKYRDSTEGLASISLSLVEIPRNGEFEQRESLKAINWENFESILDPVNNQVDSATYQKGLEKFMSVDVNYGTTFLIYKGSILVGTISAFEEYSDWRGGMVWWVYDFKLNKSEFSSDSQSRGNIIKSYISNVNILLLEEMKPHDIRNLRWQVYENDGGHVEGSETEEGELQMGIVKDVLLKSGFVKYGDDVMIMDF